jgi:hypothetical protein
MLDKGYVGIETDLRAVLPKKRKRGELNQNPNEVQRNESIASVRILVENYYGRMKGKFRVMSSKWRSDAGNYNTIFGLCIALTNFEILKRPLRKEREQGVLAPNAAADNDGYEDDQDLD